MDEINGEGASMTTRDSAAVQSSDDHSKASLVKEQVQDDPTVLR